MTVYRLLMFLESGGLPDLIEDALPLQEIREAAAYLYGANDAPAIRRLAVELSQSIGVSVSELLKQSLTDFSEHLASFLALA